MNELIVRCSCGHGVALFNYDPDDGMLMIVTYDKMEKPFLMKLKHAWKFLWKGRLDSEDILLYKEEALKVYHFLDNAYSGAKSE